MALYRDEGVVLRTYKLGEADRIVVLMTRTRGKVRAVAKGVRKTKSKFGSRLEPGSHSALLLYEGRGELDIVSQAESIDHFRAIRDDLDRLTAMSSMLEVVDQLALEGEANVALYRMLLGALRTLEANHAPLVVGGFFLKALALEGFQPMVDACVGCGASRGSGGVRPRRGRPHVPELPSGAFGRRANRRAVAHDPRRRARQGAQRAALAFGDRRRRPGVRRHGTPPRTPSPEPDRPRSLIVQPAGVGCDPAQIGRHSSSASSQANQDRAPASHWM